MPRETAAVMRSHRTFGSVLVCNVDWLTVRTRWHFGFDSCQVFWDYILKEAFMCEKRVLLVGVSDVVNESVRQLDLDNIMMIIRPLCS